MTTRHPSLIIETVANGWIVRPFDRDCCGVAYPMHVFTTMHDVQLALPDLLSRPAKPISPNEWSFIPDGVPQP